MTRKALMTTMAGLLLAACEPNVEQNSGTGTAPLNRGEVTDSRELVQPVVIGESGPRFNACQATGLIRSVAGNGELPVRAAPFDRAAQRDTLTNGDRVYICNRSHDQSWFGVIYAQNGELSGSCGVSAPVASQRRYDGPCRSGWIASAFVQIGSS
ncbi:MAG: hypothetical protein HKN78_02545 [Sphingomonadaceae bacterium]|nr:hypothetical protein [Sphingomonadaceae bacterium]